MNDTTFGRSWRQSTPRLVSGSMTDPPALAFACVVSKSDAPAASYAALPLLAVFARILVAQVLVLIFG